MRGLSLIATFWGCPAYLTSYGLADDSKQENVASLSIRFYDISPLVRTPELPQPNSATWLPPVQGSMGLSSGGHSAGGLGGGGFGGGTGVFSVPASAQFGGGGFGGAIGSHQPGFAGLSTVSVSDVTHSLQEQLEFEGTSIRDLIVSVVAPESWEDTGEGHGSIQSLGETLLVRQTQDVHQQVAAFLKTVTASCVHSTVYRLEAWWLPLQEEDRSRLHEVLAEDAAAPDAAQRLSILATDSSGQQGELLCRDRQLSHLSSGKRIPVVAGSQPVVANGSSAEQPLMQIMHLGTTLTARVSSLPAYLRDDSDSETVELSFQSVVTDPELQLEPWVAGGKVDRYVQGVNLAQGHCRLKFGQPVRIAALTQNSSAHRISSEPLPELSLVVRVTRLAQ